MRKQNDSANYFDDWEVWSDRPVPNKKKTYEEALKKETDELDNFFDEYGGQSKPVRKKKPSGKKGKRWPVLVAALAVLACVVFAFKENMEPEAKPPAQSESALAVKPTQAPVENDLGDPAPQPVKPAPAPAVKKDYRYFGNMLTEQQQKIYDIIKEGVSARDDYIGPFDTASEEEVQLIAQSVCYDYPEYFWFRGGYSSSYYDRDTHLEYTLSPLYEMDAQEYASCAAFVESATQPVLAQLSGKSDYEKVKGVYEYLVDNTIYDLNYTGTTIYEMFHDGRGVCEGYARASQYLLTKLGVEALYVTGIGGEYGTPTSQWESHAWNIVKIDGIYYQIDTTWGDPVCDDGIQRKSFNYLNLTDEEMARRHLGDNWNIYPACVDIRYNYHVYESNYLEYFSKDTILAWFQEAYARGQKLEFKCADETTYRSAYSWLVDNGGIQELFETVIPDGGYTYSYGYTDDLYILSVEKV